ncbi:hypothetical protein NVP1233A_59 [Vibrio phage 1.233.A._10N.261.51.E6]|nr:hypothetical protein NVP1233A_59 [Vibrio phage 1.233.A._10N.261.51.E6]AUR96932.1 hypothetical protein NVP1233B_59 [Vibrio phage 1.233.B._10N.261.51.E6]
MIKGCGKSIDGWHRCGVIEQGEEKPMLCDKCKVTREDGYYWVETCWGWKPAEFNSGYWFLEGQDTPLTDDWFIEIDERRIERGG